MNHRQRILAAIAFTLGLTFAAANASNAAIPANPSERAEQRFARAGNAAINAIRDARFAIVSGQPRKARDLIDSADAFLALATREAPRYEITTETIVGDQVVAKTTEHEELERILVDRRMLFVNNFVSTQERRPFVARANELFAAGKPDEALAELEDADVRFVQYWLPLDSTKAGVKEAKRLLLAEKYYETLAILRGIEDSISSRPTFTSGASST